MPRDRAMTIAQRIDKDLIEALKAREAERLGALRMVKTALKLRENEVPGSLGDEDALRVLNTLIKQRRDAAEQQTGTPQRPRRPREVRGPRADRREIKAAQQGEEVQLSQATEPCDAHTVVEVVEDAVRVVATSPN